MPNDYILRSDVEKMIREKYRGVCSSLDPYDLEFPDYKNNPTLSIRELLSEISSIQSVDRWIPVSERLPENGEKVLVYLSPIEEGIESDIKDARFFSDKLGIRFRVGAGDFVHGMYTAHKEYVQRDTDDVLYQVTHWQPLPPNHSSHDK